MTILHLDSGLEMRGGQWQVLRLIRGLRKRGHRNLLLAAKHGPLLERSQRDRIECDSLNLASLRWTSGMADLVHAHDAKSHTLAAISSRRPFLVSRRVTFPIGRNPLSQWKYSRAKLFAAVSETVAAELRRAHIPENRIRVVYDGVPLLPNKWDPKGPVVIPQFDDERKANSLPVEAARQANVPILRSTKLETDLQGASALLYLTYSEGLGSAALLAMSAGIPVIASDLGGLREVVVPGQTGWLVPNELEAIVRALKELREDPLTAERLSNAAREIAAERFSEDRMVNDTLHAYESICHVD